jgi:hypothetical protein
VQRVAGRKRVIAAARGKAAGQQHVVRYRKIGDQIELLEHKSDVIGAQPVARGGRHRRQFVAEQ